MAPKALDTTGKNKEQKAAAKLAAKLVVKLAVKLAVELFFQPGLVHRCVLFSLSPFIQSDLPVCCFFVFRQRNRTSAEMDGAAALAEGWPATASPRS